MVFLDAHCECAHGWLQSLLNRIKESPTSVVVPLIDVISSKTFEYQTDGYGFDVIPLLKTSVMHCNNIFQFYLDRWVYLGWSFRLA